MDSRGSFRRAGYGRFSVTGVPPGTGGIVADVERDARPGLQRGDVILEVDGTAVAGVSDFKSKLEAVQGGAAAQLSVQRGTARLRVPFAVRAG